MISEHLQDPKTLFFGMGMGSVPASMVHVQYDKSEPYAKAPTRSHSCLPSHLPPENAIPLPLGFLCRENGRRLEMLGVQFSNQCESHIPAFKLCALLQPLWEAPHSGIDRPTREQNISVEHVRTDDGLVRSVSSNFDFWASGSNRMPMSLCVSNADQANK